MVFVELPVQNMTVAHLLNHLNVQTEPVLITSENALVKVIVKMTYHLNVLMELVLLLSLSVKED
jgi:sulfur carrier protein ThiS